MSKTAEQTGLECGIHYGIPFDQYLQIDALNQSTLKAGLKSMAHLRAAMDAPPRKSDAMTFGTLAHFCILEPERVADHYAVFPDRYWVEEIGGAKPRATKAYRQARGEFLAANVGKEVVTVEEYDRAYAMVDALANHPKVKTLFGRDGSREATAIWDDPITDLRCKARYDALMEDEWPTICDLKTTQDASPDGFIKSIRRYRYDFQAAWYANGYKQLNESGISPNYIIVAIESEAPYGVNVFQMDEWITFGQYDFERVLRQYKRCLETNEWPGYGTDIVAPEVPRWVSDQYEGGE